MKQAVLFQRVESALLFITSLYFYIDQNFSILTFILLLFTIDIFMLGYVRGSKVGAYTYNFGHSYITPSILIILGAANSGRVLLGLGLIWFAHIAWDRAFGYGLKYESGFKHTHLGNLGKK